MADEQRPKHLGTAYKPSGALDEAGEKVDLFHLALQSTPELIAFQGLATIIVAVVISVMQWLSDLLIRSGSIAITSSNILSILFSWQGILLAIIALAVIVISVSVDIFATIYFCDGILKGDQRGVLKRTGESINRALRSLPRFLIPSGWPVLIYITFLAPLVGVGFSTILTSNIFIPTYIMEVINNTPLYKALYLIVMALLAIIGVLYSFSIFAVLLDDMRPRDAYKRSRAIIKNHWKELVKSLLKMLGAILLCTLGVAAIFALTYYLLTKLGANLPVDYTFDAEAVMRGDIQMGGTDYKVLAYRALCLFDFFIIAYLMSSLALLVTSYTTLVLTHMYDWADSGADYDSKRYPCRITKNHKWLKLFEVVGMSIILGLISLTLAFNFDRALVRPVPVQIIAHRLGGTVAPENSVEGLEVAISMHCYGAETDIQRTTDGYYVINHDDTFKRLAGVNKSPTDMSLEEVKNLRLVDPNFPDQEFTVATLEELLDVSIGNTKLFIELKGKTADTQMVDDVVKIVRERDAVDDVALISSSYDAIDYAETTYPEFDTGLLFFTEFGDLSLLNCDMLLMEEETATDEHIRQAHEDGKKAGVWTVNTRTSMGQLLNSETDYVITDRIDYATEVQSNLNKRTDLQVIVDWVMRLLR